MAGNSEIAALFAGLPPSVQNPYDLERGDSPQMQRLKLQYAQKQVFGQPIYPPEMTRQPMQQAPAANGLGDLLAQILASHQRGSGGGGY